MSDSLSLEDQLAIEALEEEMSGIVPTTPLHAPNIKATDEACEKVAVEILERHPGLVAECKHWTMQLISIMNHIDYKPALGLYAGKRSSSTHLKPIALVQKGYISTAMLDDLLEKVDEWVSEHEIVQPPDVEIVMSDDGKPVAYQAVNETGTDDRAESKDKEGWASW